MQRIRVGLLIDEMVMPAWVAKMLELISLEDGVEISLVVRNNSAKKNRSASFLRKMLIFRRLLLYVLWIKLDKRRFGSKNDALKMVDVSTALTGIPVMDVTSQQRGASDYLTSADIEQIEKFKIDVFLQFGFRAIAGDILKSATCGVWSHGSATDPLSRDSAPGVWELLRDKGVAESGLRVLAEDPADEVTLYRSWSSTDPTSLTRSWNSLYWKMASFVPRRLRELKQIGPSAFMDRYMRLQNSPFVTKQKVLGSPDNLDLVINLSGRIVEKIIAKIWSMAYTQQWILLYQFGQAGRLPDACSGFKQLLPPRDRFWADPCVFEYQGKRAVFIEELEYSNNTGYLSVITFDQHDNPVLPPVKILERPYHLSYPFIFEDNGSIYMVPETSKGGTIQLYRCCGFPEKWVFVMNLMENVSAVDTTIWRHNGRYWLFANITENEGASSWDELFLYSSDTLLSNDWRPHPCNPIVSDVRCARPAGRIFHHRGNWYRPSQDCGGRYGKAVSIQRIDLIDETSYMETPVSRIDADWDEDITRIHTLSHMGRLTCIDGLRKRGKFLDFGGRAATSGKRPESASAPVTQKHTQP